MSRQKTALENPRRPRIHKRQLDQMIEEATVDCHDESEQLTGWFTMFEENLELPFETTVLGVTVIPEAAPRPELSPPLQRRPLGPRCRRPRAARYTRACPTR